MGSVNILVVLATLLVLCLCDDYTTIECPFPEGTETPTEVRCNDFSACDWSEQRCHMSNSILASYVANSEAIMPNGVKEFYWSKPTPAKTLFNNDITDLTMQVIPHEDYHFQIKIFDRNAERYEVPIPLNLPMAPGQSPMYDVIVNNSTFGFKVFRKETKRFVLRTVGPLTYEDQFLQMTFKLHSSYLYGLGENTHMTLRHHFIPRKTFPMWSRGQGYSEEPKSLMGQHPLFTVIEDEDGNAHSVFLLNSNAMESSTFLLDDGSPALTLRTIGGVLDLHIFMGPSPEHLNMQYIKMIGLPTLPPYYYLGFQLSRYGYNDTNHIRTVVQRNQEAGIPQDVQTIDIDYMHNYRIFTYDTVNWEDLPQLADELHDDQLYLTLVLDPPVAIDWDNYPPAQRGKNNDVYIKWASPFLVPSDQPLGCEDYIVGYMWPDNKTVFPDFMMTKTRKWWTGEIFTFHKTVPFDSLWLDLNEPINFGTDLGRPENYPPALPDWSLKCPDNKWENPPYPTMTVRLLDNESGRISDSTICMSSLLKNEETSFLHYDVHALYGLKNAQGTFAGLVATMPTKRSMVLGASTYPGYGRYGAHWLGDNHSTWDHMRLSVIGIIEFNMFGIPMVGADICGHIDNSSPKLCARWTQLGAFYSFSRNHNNEGNRDQDPASWGNEVRAICREALLIRYTYLPYLYTLLYKASIEGSSVIRPLWNMFPDDLPSRDVQDQFFWGSGLMIAPVLEEGATQRSIYFPQGIWYDLLTGIHIPVNESETMIVSAPLDVIPLYLLGGNILPAQEPAIRTSLSRLNPMKLVVATDEDHFAYGEFFWDNGFTTDLSPTNVQFVAIAFEDDTLDYSIMYGSVASQSLIFDQVKIFDANHVLPPERLYLNQVDIDPKDWTYDLETKVLVVNIKQSISEDWTLSIERIPIEIV